MIKCLCILYTFEIHLDDKNNVIIFWNQNTIYLYRVHQSLSTSRITLKKKSDKIYTFFRAHTPSSFSRDERNNRDRDEGAKISRTLADTSSGNLQCSCLMSRRASRYALFRICDFVTGHSLANHEDLETVLAVAHANLIRLASWRFARFWPGPTCPPLTRHVSTNDLRREAYRIRRKFEKIERSSPQFPPNTKIEAWT